MHPSDGLAASPDLNGDLVYSEDANLYGAYFVITDYSGSYTGHFGDSIEYVADNGTLVAITGATSSWGCSHNTGIALEAADEPPYASVCAEDQGAIWLNSQTQGMTNNGVKISNENTTNGGSGEPMGGMSGSYSALARFGNATNYILTWVSRGAIDLTKNTWMGNGYTHSLNRTNNRNVAIAFFSDKDTIVGSQATSEVGAVNGDSQINWVTQGSADCSNAHAATFDTENALISWEEIDNPTCDYTAMGCCGQFSGTYFQQVDSSGNKIGQPLVSMDVYVAGDMITMNDGRICWPYINMDWDLSGPVDETGSTTTKMSFACINLTNGSSSGNGGSTSPGVYSTTNNPLPQSSVYSSPPVAYSAPSSSPPTYTNPTIVSPPTVSLASSESSPAVPSSSLPPYGNLLAAPPNSTPNGVEPTYIPSNGLVSTYTTPTSPASNCVSPTNGQPAQGTNAPGNNFEYGGNSFPTDFPTGFPTDFPTDFPYSWGHGHRHGGNGRRSKRQGQPTEKSSQPLQT